MMEEGMTDAVDFLDGIATRCSGAGVATVMVRAARHKLGKYRYIAPLQTNPPNGFPYHVHPTTGGIIKYAATEGVALRSRPQL